MGKGRTPGAAVETAREQTMRDQEVVRARRELTAYFRGQRTEREARAALKIIRAFVRDRERGDARSRRPLPGLDAVTTRKALKGEAAPKRRRRAAQRRPGSEAAALPSAGDH